MSDGPDNAPVGIGASGGRPGAQLWRPVVLIPLLTLVVFAGSLRSGFVNWDDDKYIRDNPHMTAPNGLVRIWTTLESPQYYPLTFTSYWLEYRLWGDWPAGYHAVNLALHLVNALLVFAMARALGASRRVAWLTAGLFGVHPMQVASVVWLAERKNVLSGALALISALLYLRSRRTGRQGPYIGAIVTFALALLAKTVVASLPLSLILAERLILGRRIRDSLRRTAPMIALALAMGVVTLIVERGSPVPEANLLERTLTAASAVWFYVGKLLAPTQLRALYPMWNASAAMVQWWLPLVGLLAAAAAVWRWRRAVGGLGLWALAHFALMIAPASGLVPFNYLTKTPVADHFVYLAAPGFFLAAALLLERLLGRIRAANVRTATYYALATAALAALGAKTLGQTPLWRDGVQFWTTVVAQRPAFSKAHNNLAVSLALEGRLEESLPRYREAVRLEPTLWMARVNIGKVLDNLGRFEEALAEFEALAALAPDDAFARLNLADALGKLGRVDEAIVHLRQAVELSPNLAAAHASLGAALAQAGRPAEGLPYLLHAARLDPNDPIAQFNLGIMRARLGEAGEAARHFQAVLRLRPDFAPAWTYLGRSLAVQGKTAEAERCFRRALEMNPEDPAALFDLGRLLELRGRSAEAVACYRAALHVAPGAVEAALALAWLRATHEDAALRDAQEAVRLAERARQSTGPDHVRALDVLAAACAAAGRFDEAVAAADRALAQARVSGDESAAREIEQRLAGYRAGRPYVQRRAAGPP